MGGELIAVGEHGSGYNLEIIIDELDRLSIYILDAHAEGFVRISQPTLVVLINENNQSMVLKLDAVADSATGETVEHIHFRSSSSIQVTTPFEGNIKYLAIGSREYNQTKFHTLELKSNKFMSIEEKRDQLVEELIPLKIISKDLPMLSSEQRMLPDSSRNTRSILF